MAVLTKALTRLRSDFNTIAPARDHTTDGWIGDAAHKLSTSGHNPDDTAGSKSEYSDGDSIAEVRAIDVDKDLRVAGITMHMCIQMILKSPNDLKRLKYIIFNGFICSKSTGWVWRTYTGTNKHLEHGHFSGDPAYDEDDSPWSILQLTNGGGMFVKEGDAGPYVQSLQYKLKNLGFNIGTAGADGKFGPSTKTALLAACKKWYAAYPGTGASYGPAEDIYVSAQWAAKYGATTDAALVQRITELENKLKALPPTTGLNLPASVVFTGTLTKGA